jgi:hypothetical protein
MTFSRTDNVRRCNTSSLLWGKRGSTFLLPHRTGFEWYQRQNEDVLLLFSTSQPELLKGANKSNSFWRLDGYSLLQSNRGSGWYNEFVPKEEKRALFQLGNKFVVPASASFGPQQIVEDLLHVFIEFALLDRSGQDKCNAAPEISVLSKFKSHQQRGRCVFKACNGFLHLSFLHGISSVSCMTRSSNAPSSATQRFMMFLNPCFVHE